MALPHHEFWADDVSLASSKHVARSKLTGYRQITDAHLLALAIRREGKLVTFDAAIGEIVPESPRAGAALVVIPL